MCSLSEDYASYVHRQSITEDKSILTCIILSINTSRSRAGPIKGQERPVSRGHPKN